MQIKQIVNSPIHLQCAVFVLIGLVSVQITNLRAEERHGAAILSVLVEPEATLRVAPLFEETQAHDVHWFRVEIAIRMHPGATASLRPLSERDLLVASCGGSRAEMEKALPTFDYAIPSNGRYCVNVGIRLGRESGAGRFVEQESGFLLESSDQAVRFVHTLAKEHE
jgi:hypothetical protein